MVYHTAPPRLRAWPSQGSPPPTAPAAPAAAAAAVTSGKKDIDLPTHEMWKHWGGTRIFTDAIMTEALKEQYPTLTLTIVTQYGSGYVFDPFRYAAEGFASFEPIENDNSSIPSSLEYRMYLPAARRQQAGMLGEDPVYGKFLYKWQGHEFILYVAEHVGGTSEAYAQKHFYFLNGTKSPVDGLIRECGEYSVTLHDEIWVFDQGYWDKNAELYANVMKASWDNVILDADMKKGIRGDVLRFFKSEDRYSKLKVPWKRGVIYYGPPGNGKTISIKALMHTLYKLKDPIPSLSVRTLCNIFGPEYAVAQIFRKARAMSPCLLIFEDLDSIVSDRVRSYFLNEVDGITSNDGVFMIGSTNHLDRLDPGIAKRPSRFDRKWLFPKPDLGQRTQYCEFWRSKLSDNDSLEFPKGLCVEIAKITDDFSFAYIQEAFVATLLAIAERDDDPESDDEDSDDGASKRKPFNKADLLPWDYDYDDVVSDNDNNENDDQDNEADEDEDDEDEDTSSLAENFEVLDLQGNAAPTAKPVYNRDEFLAYLKGQAKQHGDEGSKDMTMSYTNDQAERSNKTTFRASRPAFLDYSSDECNDNSVSKGKRPAFLDDSKDEYSNNVSKGKRPWFLDDSKDKYDGLLLWREMKKQVEILRKQI